MANFLLACRSWTSFYNLIKEDMGTGKPRAMMPHERTVLLWGHCGLGVQLWALQWAGRVGIGGLWGKVERIGVCTLHVGPSLTDSRSHSPSGEVRWLAPGSCLPGRPWTRARLPAST